MSADDDLIVRLRRANPVDPSASPNELSAPRRAAVLEEILTMPTEIEIQPSPSAPDRRRMRRVTVGAIAGLAAAAAVAVGVILAARGDDASTTADVPTTVSVTEPTTAAPPTTPATQPTGIAPTTAVGQPTLPPIGMGSCVETYDLATLAHREMAFDGTVTAVDEGQVSFAVSEWFAGPGGPTVTLDGNGLTGGAITSVSGPVLTAGSRFLVAGDGGFVWGCGFTQPYDATVASQWRAALSG